MARSRSEDRSEYILGEQYRRQYERNRRAHLRNSTHEVAERRRARARRKRYIKYFLLFLLSFVTTAAIAALVAIGSGAAQLPF